MCSTSRFRFSTFVFCNAAAPRDSLFFGLLAFSLRSYFSYFFPFSLFKSFISQRDRWNDRKCGHPPPAETRKRIKRRTTTTTTAKIVLQKERKKDFFMFSSSRMICLPSWFLVNSERQSAPVCTAFWMATTITQSGQGDVPIITVESAQCGSLYVSVL